VVDSTLYKIGIRNGDKILTVDGEPIDDYERLRRKVLLGESMTILRDGKEMNLVLPVDLIGQLVENRNKDVSGFVEPRKPAMVLFVPDTTNAYKAGLRVNDQITSIDSIKIDFYDELQNELSAHRGQSITLGVLRDGKPVSFPINVTKEGKLGFQPYGLPGDYQRMDSLGWIDLNVTKYSFFAAFPAGVRKAGQELSFYIDQFKKILNPKTGAIKGVGGFKAIGSIFPKYGWNWEAFWTITAFLSIILAFMNLLPIPALDGGHVMFTLYEMISRRKPNEKFLEYAQMAGMIFLLLLMLYANGNDWFGWGR
jgi:regulator of sigma E protease